MGKAKYLIDKFNKLNQYLNNIFEDDTFKVESSSSVNDSHNQYNSSHDNYKNKYNNKKYGENFKKIIDEYLNNGYLLTEVVDPIHHNFLNYGLYNPQDSTLFIVPETHDEISILINKLNANKAYSNEIKSNIIQ
jgi:hypothetical protein